ncbi:hypothetical protein [Solidesulfovibrio carbinoliphilus]|uniref:hypothetical protein n=1 Tax=Solidesulfovibrio carbinoliphilus TaxID=345370 RepID=UPI0012F51FD7|nr:hypothetical protein [Solidesulfovibrio carbinoliphilus]
MPTNSKKCDSAPRKYVRRKGVARIDVTANRELIEKWLDEKYSAEAIFKTLIEKGIIEERYTYRTFLRALYSLVAKAKRSEYRPSTTRAAPLTPRQQEFLAKKSSSKNEEEIQRSPVIQSKCETKSFTIPKNNITGDDE